MCSQHLGDKSNNSIFNTTFNTAITTTFNELASSSNYNNFDTDLSSFYMPYLHKHFFYYSSLVKACQTYIFIVKVWELLNVRLVKMWTKSVVLMPVLYNCFQSNRTRLRIAHTNNNISTVSSSFKTILK